MSCKRVEFMFMDILMFLVLGNTKRRWLYCYCVRLRPAGFAVSVPRVNGLQGNARRKNTAEVELLLQFWRQ